MMKYWQHNDKPVLIVMAYHAPGSGLYYTEHTGRGEPVVCAGRIMPLLGGTRPRKIKISVFTRRQKIRSSLIKITRPKDQKWDRNWVRKVKCDGHRGDSNLNGEVCILTVTLEKIQAVAPERRRVWVRFEEA